MLQQTVGQAAPMMQLVMPALLGGAMGIVSSLVATRIQQRARASEATEKIQIQYLNPLLVATTDLRERQQGINKRVADKDTLLRNSIQELKDRTHLGTEYPQWVNGLGHFALSTLYITAVFFAHASKIRADLPFVRLSSGDDRTLLDHLARIRRALGTDLGIWEDLQDSFGSYIRKVDGATLNFREFCTLLEDDGTRPWFMRLLDFYLDIDKKFTEQREEMIQSLQTLEAFLSRK